MITKIYALCETNGAVRYIGKTHQTLKHRLCGHLDEARKGAKNQRCQWVRMMLKWNKKPRIKLIATVEGDGNETERQWINFFLNEGFNLTNGTMGGDEPVVYQTRKRFQRKRYEEQKIKMMMHQPFKVIDLENDKIFYYATQFDDAIDYKNIGIFPYQSSCPVNSLP